MNQSVNQALNPALNSEVPSGTTGPQTGDATGTLTDSVYRHLTGRLVAGRLGPGDKLSLRSVAEALGVSMMPAPAAAVAVKGPGLQAAREPLQPGFLLPAMAATIPAG